MNGWNAFLFCLALGATVLLTIGSARDASAQNFPTRPITAITNVSPGGTYDIFMRALSDGIRTVSGQPLIIEPRPGGNYMIAGRACADAAPNGYTICALTGETIVMPEFIFKRVPYDSKRDFAAVTTLLFNTQVLVVNADLKVKSLEELAAPRKPDRERWLTRRPHYSSAHSSNVSTSSTALILSACRSRAAAKR
jgi:tripartite-type tricarboxylate transporter receptor subunit TctC